MLFDSAVYLNLLSIINVNHIRWGRQTGMGSEMRRKIRYMIMLNKIMPVVSYQMLTKRSKWVHLSIWVDLST